MQKIDNLNFSAASAGGRAMKTLRTWGLEIDEGKIINYYGLFIFLF